MIFCTSSNKFEGYFSYWQRATNNWQLNIVKIILFNFLQVILSNIPKILKILFSNPEVIQIYVNVVSASVNITCSYWMNQSFATCRNWDRRFMVSGMLCICFWLKTISKLRKNNLFFKTFIKTIPLFTFLRLFFTKTNTKRS